MGNLENSFNSMSNECKAGNHDACPGQTHTPTGNIECKCMHHKNVPTSVDDIPVTSDTPWRVAHDS
jgi:hypothetical protein